MHSLTELKKLLEQKFEIIKFDGMYLYTIHGKWSMTLDEYRLNGFVISREDIKKLL